MGLKSLLLSGTRVWLDAADPQVLSRYVDMGVTGVAGNPQGIANLVEAGRFDTVIDVLARQGLDDDEIAARLTDTLVGEAQALLARVWEQSQGNDGYASLDLDLLLADAAHTLSFVERVHAYVELGHQWSAGHVNRMVSVPATAAGIDALEPLAASGIALHVTMIYTPRQYEAARNAVWRGAQARGTSTGGAGVGGFKSAFCVSIGPIDVYTRGRIGDLSPRAQGLVGIVNAKRIWRQNQSFWKDKNLPLDQEVVFAGTDIRPPGDPIDKYAEALAGSGIQVLSPATIDAVNVTAKEYSRTVDLLPGRNILDDIDRRVDQDSLEDALVAEATAMAAQSHEALIRSINRKRPSSQAGR